MRKLLWCMLGVTVAAIAFAQESNPAFEPGISLIELLAQESMIAYRYDTDAGGYELQMITAEVAEASREYYSNRSENLARYGELDEQRSALVKQRTMRLLRTPPGEESPPDNSLAEIDQQIRKVSRPTGIYQVGEVTGHGKDFIGIRELGSKTEYLIPLARILFVIRSTAEEGEN